MTFLWSLLSGAAGYVAEWLAEAPAWVWLCLGAFAVGFGLGAWGLPGSERERPRVVRDTVERQIMRRDTVTEARPVRVTVYDTVRTTDIDTAYVPIPSDFSFRGMTSSSPVRVQGQEFTLTEWVPSEQRFVQSTYMAERDHWSINTEGTITSGFNLDDRSLTTIGSTVTGGLSYSDDPWSVRVAGGLATSISETQLQMLGVGELSVQYTVASW